MTCRAALASAQDSLDTSMQVFFVPSTAHRLLEYVLDCQLIRACMRRCKVKFVVRDILTRLLCQGGSCWRNDALQRYRDSPGLAEMILARVCLEHLYSRVY